MVSDRAAFAPPMVDHSQPATLRARCPMLWSTIGGVLGASLAGWLNTLATVAGPAAGAKKSCILLWMNGGPSQTDTFDLKPGHAHGGPFKAIATRASGISICEHLPGI